MFNIDERQLQSILSQPGYKVRSSLSLVKNITGTNNPPKTLIKTASRTSKGITKKNNSVRAIDLDNRHADALLSLKLSPELETGINLAGVKVNKANYEHWMQVRLFDFIFSHFNDYYLDFAAVPNGGLRTNRGASELSDEGVRNGYPDILGDVPKGCYHGLRIELKYGSNKPSNSQIQQLNRKRASGYFCAVCWSFDEAVEVVSEYLELPIGAAMSWSKNESEWVIL